VHRPLPAIQNVAARHALQVAELQVAFLFQVCAVSNSISSAFHSASRIAAGFLCQNQFAAAHRTSSTNAATLHSAAPSFGGTAVLAARFHF
jgi:hypothetical protein